MEAELLERIAQHIGKLTKPVSFSTLRTGLRKSGLKINDTGLQEALHVLIHHSRTFCHPSSKDGRNPSPCYFSRSPLQYVQDTLLGALHSKPKWTESALRKKVTQVYQSLFDEAVGHLINAGRLFECRQDKVTYLTIQPPRNLPEVKQAILERVSGSQRLLTRQELKSALPDEDRGMFTEAVSQLIAEGRLFEKGKRLTTEPPLPTDFLTETHKNSLRKIVGLLNEHRRDRLAFETLLALLNGELAAPTRALDQELSEEWLVRWYGEDLPRREGLRSMPIPWTWKHYVRWCEERGMQPNTDRFHQLLKSMAMHSRIALTAHDSPRNLPTEEAAILLKDPKGRTIYYWTVLT
jgi:AcrR family transcriptional regulator